MQATTRRAYPLPIREAKGTVDGSTVGARLARRRPLVDTNDLLAVRACDILKRRHECVEAKIADLATPQRLHPLQVQRLEAERVVLGAQRPPSVSILTGQITPAN